MIKIDELPRITLRSCSILFRQVKQIAEALPNASEKNREAYLDLFSQIVGTFTAWGIRYNITPIPSDISGKYELIETKALLFEWENGGKQYRQVVRLWKEPSNLGLSSVTYFLCPHTGRKCRKLYTDGKVITSRWAYRHTYSQRNKSRKNREMEKIMNYYEKDPRRKYGKTEYRGKRTPYGERLRRYFSTPQPTEGDWAAILPKRIGRPPKWLASI